MSRRESSSLTIGNFQWWAGFSQTSLSAFFRNYRLLISDTLKGLPVFSALNMLLTSTTIQVLYILCFWTYDFWPFPQSDRGSLRSSVLHPSFLETDAMSLSTDSMRVLKSYCNSARLYCGKRVKKRLIRDLYTNATTKIQNRKKRWRKKKLSHTSCIS